ncbi:MAG: DsbA family protein [Chloroflexi bacterium]|nr:DsbA family protein [Chloroflexota bacterium]
MAKPKRGKGKKNVGINPLWILGGGIFIAILLFFVFSPSGLPITPSTSPGSSQVEDPSLGNPQAPVTIIEYSDFQCPFCATFSLETFPLLREQYVDAGKVFFIFRDFPIPSHQQAPKAAEAGNCAAEQGQFWAMHDTLFSHQMEWQGNAQAVSLFQGYAQDLGIDSPSFSACLDSGKYAGEIQDDFQTGVDAGVTGTPTFFINDQIIVGAQPFSEFQRVIEQELSS